MSGRRRKKPNRPGDAQPVGDQKHKPVDDRQQVSTRSGAALAGLTIVVALVVLVTHWRALSARALSFDDADYLTINRLVQNPSWASARRFLTEVRKPSTVSGYYQPLSMISLMLDYAGGGRIDHLQPFHRTSLILHLCNAALVILLLYSLFGRLWVAAMVGLLFGVHPLTVEPIPWIGERKTLLAALFAEALRRNGDYVEAHNNMGIALVRIGQIDEAIGEYRKALQINPEHVQARSGLSVLSARKGG